MATLPKFIAAPSEILIFKPSMMSLAVSTDIACACWSIVDIAAARPPASMTLANATGVYFMSRTGMTLSGSARSGSSILPANPMNMDIMKAVANIGSNPPVTLIAFSLLADSIFSIICGPMMPPIAIIGNENQSPQNAGDLMTTSSGWCSMIQFMMFCGPPASAMITAPPMNIPSVSSIP